MIIDVKDGNQNFFLSQRYELNVSTSHPLLNKYLSPTENDASSLSSCALFLWGALEVRLDQKTTATTTIIRVVNISIN